MKKFLKWIGIVIGSLILIIALTTWILASKLDSMRKETFTVAPSNITIPGDSASLERGKYWARALCTDCHGTDFGGTPFFDDPKMGAIHALNLTAGKGGIGSKYSDEDWIAVIRHGIRKGGGGVMIMPSQYLNHLDDHDLACMVAYLKTLPPVDKEWADPHFTYMTRVIAGAGGFGTLYAASVIDHSKTSGITAPAEGATAEYGEYLLNVTGCKSCHGEKLNGNQPNDPNSPVAPNITAGGNLGNWTDEQFILTLRSGTTPEGKALNPEFMPWLGISKFNDDALKALYLYLQSQPKLPPAEI